MVGRSNVGKSSLINALVKQKIARTSAAPGKTRLVNYYLIQSPTPSPQSLYLVDLPGYGYARGGRESVDAFEQLTQAYFDPSTREERRIGGVLQLVDSRHPDLPQDQAGYAWLLAVQAPVAIVATKIDKLNRADPREDDAPAGADVRLPCAARFGVRRRRARPDLEDHPRLDGPMNSSGSMNALRSRLWRLRDRASDLFRKGYRASVFTRIYEENLWGEQGSVSGPGSIAVATARVTTQLPEIWRQYGITSLVDAPCGDCNWMSGIAPLLDRYTGIDIVETLIQANRARYPMLEFRCADLTRDPLPTADAIHCRDCFQHLPTYLIVSALANFETTGARWLLLTTNDEVVDYHDTVIGGFRPINFQLPPFNFPAPVCAIAEDPAGRSLALWDLSAKLIRRMTDRQST